MTPQRGNSSPGIRIVLLALTALLVLAVVLTAASLVFPAPAIASVFLFLFFAFRILSPGAPPASVRASGPGRSPPVFS